MSGAVERKRPRDALRQLAEKLRASKTDAERLVLAETLELLGDALPAPMWFPDTEVAEWHYRLVMREAAPHMVVPWDKLPASHRDVFVRAMGAFIRGEKP